MSFLKSMIEQVDHIINNLIKLNEKVIKEIRKNKSHRELQELKFKNEIFINSHKLLHSNICDDYKFNLISYLHGITNNSIKVEYPKEIYD